MSLRMRFVSSYLVVLAVTLGVITVALLLFLAAQPAVTGPTYERLATIGREFLNTLNTGETRLTQLQGLASLRSRGIAFAEENDVRVLILTNVSNDSGTIFLDTAADYQRGDILSIRTDDGAYQLPAFLQRILSTQVRTTLGDFKNTGDSRWLYIALEVLRPNESSFAVLVADHAPEQTLGTVIAQFRDTLALPLLQAAIVGLVVALILAVIISGSLIRTLHDLSAAAAAVMRRDYAHRVPVRGAPEVRAVAEAFNAMNAETQANLQAQQDFVANISHDLKTPLTSIQGYSQAIIDGTAKDPAHAATIIHEEAGRLNRLVVELTDLARLQAGRLSMQTVPLDMGQLTSAIGQRLAIVAEKKNIALHIESPTMPEIFGDGDRLAQVLTNLVSNALKYTPSGGQVWIKTQINHGGIEVIVQDTGMGIPPEDLPRIFERFYQVDKARGPRRGTGLGLPIAHEIIKAHQGQIAVTSGGTGKGTSFTIWLPSPHLNTVAR
ncbi:MAG: HAMP domain-containing histidine kinase [Anaerolineaceae bacterium]|nr:HAMP domain-containing histidine kinase [Anaerolineaceae bacterium]